MFPYRLMMGFRKSRNESGGSMYRVPFLLSLFGRGSRPPSYPRSLELYLIYFDLSRVE